MANTRLWEFIKELKTEKYKWIDLTHELSPETPHWFGFKPLGIEKLFDFPEAPMRVYQYTHPGQYGTHVDAPIHFDPKGRTLAEIRPDEMVYPLVVVDKSKEVENNKDYVLTVDDLKAWEAQNGRIRKEASWLSALTGTNVRRKSLIIMMKTKFLTTRDGI